ncbi:hypothetical protein [Duncaniella dubosii]|uniref:hypothetical protein n=1 Tax=Duncaniella dubosii TaxID=2518971 RepID=UPI003F67A8C7
MRAHHRRPFFRERTSGLSIGHISPEAANGGNIGLVRGRATLSKSTFRTKTINVRLTGRRADAERKEGKPSATRHSTPVTVTEKCIRLPRLA